jgi:hypothetical protein
MLMELPSTRSHLGWVNDRDAAKFLDFLAPEQFGAYLDRRNTKARTRSGGFWAKWIDVLVERAAPESDGPKGKGSSRSGPRTGPNERKRKR